VRPTDLLVEQGFAPDCLQCRGWASVTRRSERQGRWADPRQMTGLRGLGTQQLSLSPKSVSEHVTAPGGVACRLSHEVTDLWV